MKVSVKKLDHRAVIPSRATDGAESNMRKETK